jgi:hypothetical protein
VGANLAHLASPINHHDARGNARLVQSCLNSASMPNFWADDDSHILFPWRTTNEPWFFLPGKHTTYGCPHSAHMLVFGKEDILQGVPNLRDPCIRTTFSEVALCSEDLAENPQRLQNFAGPMELGLGETTGFEVSIGPP